MTPVVPLPSDNTASLEHVPASDTSEVRRRSITRRLFGAAIDRLVLTAMIREERLPGRDDVARLQSELERTCSLFEARGYLNDMRSYHSTPNAPKTVYVRRSFQPGVRCERISFASEFEPKAPKEPRERYNSYRENKTAYAWMARHQDDQPRPWLICVHGLGTGAPWMDYPAFRARYLHKELGLNLLFPLLPLHGPRRPRGMDRNHMLSFELMDTLHAFAQALWDIRRMMAWLRSEGATRIGIHGLSAGAYTSALLSQFEPLDLIIAGIPLVHIPEVFEGHTPAEMRTMGRDQQIPAEVMRNVFRVISPTTYAPSPSLEKRFIYAGVEDRVTPPAQALALWEAWQRPALEWFEGGHVSFFWSRRVESFVRRALLASDFTVHSKRTQHLEG